ncbi:hypothetical protein HMPREF9618_00936 [Cutibacterium acnes HL082PA1]|nr:hypothetical protein HMPREF9618_00936 [Cutibacterium acnes HL082PA1]
MHGGSAWFRAHRQSSSLVRFVIGDAPIVQPHLSGAGRES